MTTIALVGEYEVSDIIGMQIGYLKAIVHQELSNDSGSGALIDYSNPFVGAKCYVYKSELMNYFLISRFGVISGKLTPGDAWAELLSAYYNISKLPSYNISGTTLGGGLGAEWNAIPGLILGSSVMITKTFIKTQEKAYTSLGRNLSILSIQLGLNLNYWF